MVFRPSRRRSLSQAVGETGQTRCAFIHASLCTLSKFGVNLRAVEEKSLPHDLAQAVQCKTAAIGRSVGDSAEKPGFRGPAIVKGQAVS